ncbi:MAG TPA: glucose 1-dehydrogenase [Thermomicrobiales bacterium]|jgi:gluconate 5-dehydrogenase|nr:glucose 1-dehydrogenase [Thermomicrobiales bacterium]
MTSASQWFDLTGQTAIVTGAGSGLGVVFSQALAEAGANVVCADLQLAPVAETARSLERLGRQALPLAVDVTDEHAVAAMIAQTLTRFGRLDIVVNNAGVAAAGPPEALMLADWRRVVDVNLTGVFLVARAAAREMIACGRGGRIVNIASILGAGASEPIPAAAYAATKGGVVNLTRDLAVHWAPYGIRVNALGPAYFPSAMTKELLATPAMRAEIERRTPLGRVGRPEELKGPLVFLASEASSYVTGQTLFVDGGWTAW